MGDPTLVVNYDRKTSAPVPSTQHPCLSIQHCKKQEQDLQMDEFLSFIGAELIHSLVLDDVDWDLQMDECLPFTGRELVQSPVLGQADGSGPADGRVSPLHWGRTRTVSCPWANCSVFELKCACKISAPKVLHSWENLIFVDLHKMSILPQQHRCCSNTVPCRTLPAHMPTCPTSQHAGIALMAFMLSGHLCSSSSSCSSCSLPHHALASLCAGKLWTPVQSSS